jgi:hypothetical protein
MSTTIEGFGSTSLIADGSNYFLQPNGGSAVELSVDGTPVVAGQFGSWAPIGAEQTASGYEVAWKITGADQYTVWYFDNSGNYVSSALNVVSGSSAALQSFETSFQQDSKPICGRHSDRSKAGKASSAILRKSFGAAVYAASSRG